MDSPLSEALSLSLVPRGDPVFPGCGWVIPALLQNLASQFSQDLNPLHSFHSCLRDLPKAVPEFLVQEVY